MDRDRITLTVPTRGEYAKTVRMTAAELASRIGMSFDEVDDVRIGAEEAFVYASECLGEDAEVTFVFTVSANSLEAEVGPMPARDDSGAGASEGYAEFILRSVCDEFSIERAPDGCRLRLCRRAAATSGATGA
jgi:serine/threonine-protein kinase RsbW